MLKRLLNLGKSSMTYSNVEENTTGTVDLAPLDMFPVGGYFPPLDHRARIDRYKNNRKLFKGLHQEVFKTYNGSEKEKELLYVSVNLAGTICKKSADFLFGEDMQVSAGNENNSNEQLALNRFVEENHLSITNYESALANAYRGDVFVKVRYGQEFAGDLPLDIDTPRVIIEPVNAENVFPQTSPFDHNKIVGFHIAVPTKVYVDGKQVWQLFVESHFAGRIEYRVYNLSTIETTARGNVVEVNTWKIQDEVVAARQIVSTGVAAPLVVHIPNYSTDDSWEGIDDISEHVSVLEEINNRLTQIADILDKHSDPALAVGTGILGEDLDGKPTFHVQRDKVFEIMGKDDVVPQYITWEGQLAHAFGELDRLVELLLTTAEIPAVALGKGDSGTSGSSGLAIKWRMNSLLSKINRKRQYYDRGLKQVLVLSQMLEHAVNPAVVDYAVTIPKLTFADGLPKDNTEEATVMNIRTGGMKTLSQKTAIMRMENMTEEQAEIEIERIEEEQKAAMERQAFTSPNVFNEPIDVKDADKNKTDKHAEGNPITDKANKKPKGRPKKKKEAEE